MVFPDHHAGIEPVGRDANLESAIRFEMVADQFDEFLVIVNDQRFALPAFEGIGGNSVFLHELVQDVPRNPAKFRAGYAKALELARVKAANDRLLADLADSGRLTRGIDRFHIAHKASFSVSTTPNGRRRAIGRSCPCETRKTTSLARQQA